MTNLTESAMFDPDEKGGGNTRINFWMMLCGVGIIMIFGAIVGVLSDYIAEGEVPSDPALFSVLGILVTVSVVLGFAIWKLAQQVKQSGEKVTRREKLNNRVLIGTGLFGGIIGLTLAVADSIGANDGNLFTNSPMSSTLAIILSIAIGVIMPAITLYWHKRVVDELEEAAYRAGALMGFYAITFAAPVWWFLWRGGLVPQPNGIALYFTAMFVALIVWFWKKYR